jgi:hypothetical protein
VVIRECGRKDRPSQRKTSVAAQAEGIAKQARSLLQFQVPCSKSQVFLTNHSRIFKLETLNLKL